MVKLKKKQSNINIINNLNNDFNKIELQNKINSNQNIDTTEKTKTQNTQNSNQNIDLNLNKNSQKLNQSTLIWYILWWIVCARLFLPWFFWIFSSWQTPKKYNKKNVIECKNETDKWLCIEDTISNLSDLRIKDCVVWNIDRNSLIAKNLKENNISETDIENIDWVIKECAYYKNTPNYNSTTYPVFWNFSNLANWLFNWNYRNNSFFNWLDNYNNSNNFDKNKNPIDNLNWNWFNVSNKNTIWTSMNKNSNYSLWDTGKTWIWKNTNNNNSWWSFWSKSWWGLS